MNRRNFLNLIYAPVLLPSFLRQEKINTDDLLTESNKLICEKKFELAVSLKLHNKPINEVLIEIAKSFLGTNYAANTLDAAGKEQLIINLQTLDCVTFYENSLVLARCIKKNRLSFDDYKGELQFVRYRNGIIDKYPSRLHYTSDYFFDSQKKHVLRDMTQEIGGIRFKKRIDFMSTHIESYPHLRENPGFVKEIQKIEQEINTRTLYYIPKMKLRRIASQIKNGDILGITTSIEGLDCSHTGIAIWKNKKLHLLHAPSPGKNVQISDVTLCEYLARIKKDTGIIVARPLEI